MPTRYQSAPENLPKNLSGVQLAEMLARRLGYKRGLQEIAEDFRFANVIVIDKETKTLRIENANGSQIAVPPKAFVLN